MIFEGEGTAAMVLALSGTSCYGWLLRPELLLSHLHSFLHNRFLSLTLPFFLTLSHFFVRRVLGVYRMRHFSSVSRIGGMFLDVSVSAADDCKKFLVVIF